MSRVNRTWLLAIVIASLLVAVPRARPRQGGRSGRQGGPPRDGRRGAPVQTRSTSKPGIPNVNAVRSYKSLATVALPNTMIESAAVDPDSPALFSVMAVTTHPPMDDRVRIRVAIPTSNWNGRFTGTRGSGFSGGSANGVVQPALAGYAAGATDTGHEGASGGFALRYTGRGGTHEAANFARSGSFGAR